MNTRIRNRIGLALAFSFIGFLIWSTVQFQQFFVNLIPFFERLVHENDALSVAVFIGLAVLSTMLSSFSSVPLVLIAVVVWGSIPTAIYLFIGWITGDIISYFIGYYGGNPIAKKFVPLEKVDFWRKKIPPNAEFRFVFLFIMSMPAEIPNYVLGTIRYSFGKYLAVMALGEIIFSFLIAYGIRALIEKNPLVFFGSIILLLSLFSYTFYLFQRYLRQR